MTCFCGCETYVKNEDGFKIACVKCEHGPQNHDDEFRAAARTVSYHATESPHRSRARHHRPGIPVSLPGFLLDYRAHICGHLRPHRGRL